MTNSYLVISVFLAFVTFLATQFSGKQKAHVVYLGAANEQLHTKINELEKHNLELIADLDKTMKENILLHRALARAKFPDLPTKGDFFGGRKGK